MGKSVILIIMLCISFLSIGLCEESNWEEKLDYFQKKLTHVEKLIEHGKTYEAGDLLQEARQEMKLDEPPFYGKDFPLSLPRYVKVLEALLNESEGFYENFKKMSGTVINVERSPYSGCFNIMTSDGEKRFIYNTDLIESDERMKGDREIGSYPSGNKEYKDPWNGRRVTVYYECDSIWNPDGDGCNALKLVLHD